LDVGRGKGRRWRLGPRLYRPDERGVQGRGSGARRLPVVRALSKWHGGPATCHRSSAIDGARKGKHAKEKGREGEALTCGPRGVVKEKGTVRGGR